MVECSRRGTEAQSGHGWRHLLALRLQKMIFPNDTQREETYMIETDSPFTTCPGVFVRAMRCCVACLACSR